MPPEFPFTAVRDLIGILRVLYAEELEKKHANKAKLAAIKKVGDALRRSIRLATDHDPGTAPHAKAIGMAETATLQLHTIFVDLFGMPETENTLVRIAARRVRGHPRARSRAMLAGSMRYAPSLRLSWDVLPARSLRAMLSARRIACRFLVAALIVSNGVVSSRVHAEEAPASDPAEERARADYAEGKALGRAGRWREAEERFRRAAEYRAAAPALRSLAQAQIENGKLASAKATLQRVISERDPKYPDTVRDAEAELATLEGRVPSVALVLPPGAAQPTVEIDAASFTGMGPFELDAGKHRIVVRAEPYKPFTTTVKLRVGQRRVVRVHPSATRGVLEEEPAPVEEEEAEASSPSLLGPALLGGGGLVLGVTGLAVRLGGQSTYDDAAARCKGGCPTQALVDRGNGGRSTMMLAQNEHQCCNFFQFDVKDTSEHLVWETRAEEAAGSVLEFNSQMPERLQDEPRRGADTRSLKRRATSAGLGFAADEEKRH